MDIPAKARYYYSYQKACDFIEEFEIESFPVEPKAIIKEIGFNLLSYSEIAKLKGTTISEVCRKTRSNAAIALYDKKDCYILYNNTRDENYMRFSLMHEIAHIYLGHLSDFEKTKIIPASVDLKSKLSPKEYDVLENEADAFSRNVLLPVGKIIHLKDRSISNIHDCFGVTNICASNRLRYLDHDIEWYRRLGLFQKFELLTSKILIYKKCKVCGYSTSNDGRYCAICGKILKRGKGNVMRYPMLSTNNDGKLLKCPICQNEETNMEGNFCQICGTLLKNTCMNNNCPEIQLPSNARYCPVCSSPSSFYSDHILNDWNVGVMPIPEGIEDALPFDIFGDELPFN